MHRLLVDSCVFIALLNMKDVHHEKAVRFFNSVTEANKRGDTTTLVLPAHALVEVNITIKRLKERGELEGYASFIAKGGPEEYPIDRAFIRTIQEQKLYDKFSALKSADSIYAMIAYLEGIPLCTCDSDFDRVKDIIEVRQLS